MATSADPTAVLNGEQGEKQYYPQEVSSVHHRSHEVTCLFLLLEMIVALSPLFSLTVSGFERYLWITGQARS